MHHVPRILARSSRLGAVTALAAFTLLVPDGLAQTPVAGTGAEAHPAHIRRHGIDLVDVPSCLEAVVPAAQIQQEEFIRRRWLILRSLDVHTAYPVSTLDQVLHQVVTDESTSSSNENSRSCLGS